MTNISWAIWASGIEKMRVLFFCFFFQGQICFSNIFYTSGIEMSQHFQGPFGPLVLTFCGPSPNFKGSWPEGPPCYGPCLFSTYCLYSGV